MAIAVYVLPCGGDGFAKPSLSSKAVGPNHTEWQGIHHIFQITFPVQHIHNTKIARQKWKASDHEDMRSIHKTILRACENIMTQDRAGTNRWQNPASFYFSPVCSHTEARTG